MKKGQFATSRRTPYAECCRGARDEAGALTSGFQDYASGEGVVIDFKSPQAYLAIGPTCALADKLRITIDWQPLIVTLSKTALQRHLPAMTEARVIAALAPIIWTAISPATPRIVVLRLAGSNGVRIQPSPRLGCYGPTPRSAFTWRSPNPRHP